MSKDRKYTVSTVRIFSSHERIMWCCHCRGVNIGSYRMIRLNAPNFMIVLNRIMDSHYSLLPCIVIWFYF
jgi:hypothetical protein